MRDAKDWRGLLSAARRIAAIFLAAALLACFLAPQESRAQEVPEYKLGSGDRVRVTVFGEDNLSGEFEVDGGGQISMPLIGSVPAGGKTVRHLEQQIATQLRDGYLKDPKVAVQVLNYRPFYILGEVNEPGSYPYRSDMTVLNAVVMGGGYTPRADEDDITITRANDPSETEREVTAETKVLPGDVVRIGQRFF